MILRIVSIVWYYTDKFTNDNIKEYIRKPLDFKINNSHIHNITNKIAKENGLLLSKIFKNKRLGYAIKCCDIIITHNCFFWFIYFDEWMF